MKRRDFIKLIAVAPIVPSVIPNCVTKESWVFNDVDLGEGMSSGEYKYKDNYYTILHIGDDWLDIPSSKLSKARIIVSNKTVTVTIG